MKKVYDGLEKIKFQNSLFFCFFLMIFFLKIFFFDLYYHYEKGTETIG